MKTKLKWFLYIDIAIIFAIVSYKIYLNVFEKGYDSLNIANIVAIQENAREEKGLTFAVLGNIENSIDVFENRIIPSINMDRDIDFLISSGNAVLNGDEDKYRMLSRVLQQLFVPSVIGVGDREVKGRGATIYYEYFGPLYFSFEVDNSYFIFLDTSGISSEEWQRNWLLKEMELASEFEYLFVIMNRLPYKAQKLSILNNNPYIENEDYRIFLTNLFEAYEVDAVFTSGLDIFDEREIGGVPYYVSGGAGGGLLRSHEASFYHYLKVEIGDDGVMVHVVEQEQPHALFLLRPLERIWIYIHSLFYINMLNLILILGILLFVGIILYIRLTKEVDYYRNFSSKKEAELDGGNLKIAMFTNNYFPYIGGVPISIMRLSKGLREKGHTVHIYAPRYPGEGPESDPNVIRCRLLYYLKTKYGRFAMANIFSSRIEKEFVKHKYDVIHVHHPFWMGTKGLDLGQKYNIPVIFSYHTRLDSYSHYLPFMRLLFKNLLSHQMIKEFSQKCTAIFAPTETSKEYLSNIGVSRQTEVMPTGVDFSQFDGEPNANLRKNYGSGGEILICSVSRLSKEKNIFFLVAGIKYVKEHTSVPFKFVLIGDGPDKDDILMAVRDAGLQDEFILLGEVAPDEVGKCYMACDFFVYASKSETQGMVLLEAMAGRCPVVAISSSGIEDVIVDDYNGYKTMEEVEAWSDKVIALINNKEKLTNMSKNAYDYAKNYSMEAMASRASEAYIKAISKYKAYNRKDWDNG